MIIMTEITIIIWQLVSKVKESKPSYTLAATARSYSNSLAAVETTTPLHCLQKEKIFFSSGGNYLQSPALWLKLHQTMQIDVYYDFNIEYYNVFSLGMFFAWTYLDQWIYASNMYTPWGWGLDWLSVLSVGELF